MSIEDASRCVEGSIELYIELYIEDVEARAQRAAPAPRAGAARGSCCRRPPAGGIRTIGLALVLEPEERRLSVELCGSDLLVFPLEQGSRRRR